LALGAHVLLPYLVRELEARLLDVPHGLQRIELSAGMHRLAGRHHAHVDILLVSSLDLLLLLL
jgi:hypothetical protein